ncbi:MULTISPECIES: histidine kinase [Elizabethkingia]|uniref:histidine kinase n=1 Tax=Elizabethkingia TaxID=308865 RepID=UPI0021A6163A|nr:MULTISPECIES: histidine kinase [Elizabethkingia]MCT3689578.1 histidine kinase [Elizabethkingia anophelis]MCT3706334.1 histidine kinase [Elizabethkingia anophelis]MCT3713352.1 histidine kinase [Elizabethkingia anophelis]MCT3716770.1 histidine kinase [Elizabethkingia anophelis]MCT3730471.1 histidine kinase [Elizabethkingia anophelis]
MAREILDYEDIISYLKRKRLDLEELDYWNLAIQIKRNQILERALVIDQNSEPTPPEPLEAIAIALGFTNVQTDKTITQVLKDISDQR